jgi:transposase-like protein
VNKRFSLGEFLKKFGSNEKCLEYVKRIKYPKGIFCQNCKKLQSSKIKNRQVYQCSCGFQVAPLVGTIFEKTTTPLQYWFYAVFLMSVTRSGISAKQLQRELGVTYKTAWRMFKQIRMLMTETSGRPLEGIVEVDETFVGGKGRNRRDWRQGVKEKEVLMGMVARGGKVYLKHVPNTGKWTLLRQIKERIDPKAIVYTDELQSYKNLYKYGYTHDSVAHGIKQYAKGDVHTQNIENFWSHFKRGIYGVYRVISPKYLQTYADEYGWRYNNREAGSGMFELLLNQVAEVRTVVT